MILIFHVVGTVMEIFKTGAGSWLYPEPSLLRIGGVPLFSGFMYAAVGSYLARVTRIFDFRFTHYPPLWATVVLAGAIYVELLRPPLRLGFPHPAVCGDGGALSRGRGCTTGCSGSGTGCRCCSASGWSRSSSGSPRTSATWSRAWIYPSQEDGWHLVGIEKLGAWLLLMIISFVLVTLVHRPQRLGDAVDSEAGARLRSGPLQRPIESPQMTAHADLAEDDRRRLGEARRDLDRDQGAGARRGGRGARTARQRQGAGGGEEPATAGSVNQWLKKAVLLSFRLNPNALIEGPGGTTWWDKVPSKFEGWGENRFREAGLPRGAGRDRPAVGAYRARASS